jgi:MFS family permease
MLSLSFLVASFVVVLVGMLTDIIGRRVVLAALLAMSAIFVGLHAFANSLVVLTILRVCGFALGAGLYLVASTMVLETAPQKYRGIVAGALQTGYPLGFALSALVITPFIDSHGWRSVFLPAFIIFFLSPILYYYMPESSRFTQSKSKRNDEARDSFLFGIKDLLSRYKTPLLVCFSGSFFVSMAIGGTSYFLPTYLVDHFGLPLSEAGKVVGSSYAIGAAGYLLAATFGEFVFTRRNTLIVWIILGGLFFLYTIWQATIGWILSTSLGLTIMFLYGSEAVRMPLIGELFPTDLRGTATAISGSLAVTSAWLISPLLISNGVDAIGWSLSFTLFCILPLILSSFSFSFLTNRSSNIGID